MLIYHFMMKRFVLLFAALGLLFACTPEENNTGDNNGNDGTVQAVTVEANHVSAISAVLAGKANLGSSVASDLKVGFQYSKSAGILPSNSTTVEATDADANYNYTASITGLEPATTYYFRSFVRQNGQDTYGETKEFTTKDVASLLETNEASNVEAEKATLNAKLDLTDVQYKSLAYGFLWGGSESALNTDFKCTEIKDNAISAVLTNLSNGTQYWYKAYFQLDSQTLYGEVKTFTTMKKYTAVAGEAVNLGLSVKWSSMNLGATSPTDYGDYFAWGETAPKDNYSWATYELCNGSSSTLTKYNNSSSYGTVDNKTEFKDYDYEDDAARQALGGKWRVPTDAEWTELRDNCTWTWVENYNGSGINGRLVKSKTNSNSIFLPAAGYRYDSDLYSAGSDGDYWSSSLYTDGPGRAWGVYFDSVDILRFIDNRYYGRSVRPVSE